MSRLFSTATDSFLRVACSEYGKGAISGVGFLLNFCDDRGHKCGDKCLSTDNRGLPVGSRAYGLERVDEVI
jgi:hypothetical protein